jgi:hypothetical protein
MPAPYSHDLRLRVMDAARGGPTYQEVTRRFRVSNSTIPQPDWAAQPAQEHRSYTTPWDTIHCVRALDPCNTVQQSRNQRPCGPATALYPPRRVVDREDATSQNSFVYKRTGVLG